MEELTLTECAYVLVRKPRTQTGYHHVKKKASGQGLESFPTLNIFPRVDFYFKGGRGRQGGWERN